MCKIEGCYKKIRCKNLCQFHYHRSMRDRYKDTSALEITVDNPHPKTLEAQKEFNEGLWEFVKKELSIKC